MTLAGTIERLGNFLGSPFGENRFFEITESQARVIRGFGRFDMALVGDVAGQADIIPSLVSLIATQLEDKGLLRTLWDQDLEVLDLTKDGIRLRKIIQNPFDLPRSRLVMIIEDPKPVTLK